MSPPEWQEAQKTKGFKADVLTDGDVLDEQNREPEESAIRNGKYGSKDYEDQGTTG